MDETSGKTRNPLTTRPLEMHDTFILSKEYTLRRILGLSPASSDNQTHPGRELALIVRGMAERIVLDESRSVILGRGDLKTGYRPDVDLTPYGAYTRGVSRSHARLHLADQQLYITDLGSANGTFLGGERLAPDQPRLLHNGDQLLLGSLGVSVVFA